MKNVILISFTALLSLNGASVQNSEVYLCDSSGGKKYHYTKNCRGLSNCRHEIIKVSFKKASAMGKELCGWE